MTDGGSGKVLVGLTGGFGCGKSTVSAMFRDLGAGVIDADKLVHEALCKGSPVYGEVARLFRKDRLDSGRELDHKKIASIIFKDARQRKKLEAITHRYVFQRILGESGEAREKVIILEIPLLFETGFDQYCHWTVAVWAPEAVNTRRLVKKGFLLNDIRARRKAQFSAREKMKRADIIIKNSGTLAATRRQVEKVWGKITLTRKELYNHNAKGKGRNKTNEKN